MAEERTAFERYMHGEPLNDELAALRAGEPDRLPTAAQASRPPILNADRGLTMTERAHLRELRAHEGWPVLLRLAQKVFTLRQQSVISMSQADPLENSAAIGRQWAQLVMYRQGVADLLDVAVTNEVKKEREEADDVDGD